MVEWHALNQVAWTKRRDFINIHVDIFLHNIILSVTVSYPIQSQRRE